MSHIQNTIPFLQTTPIIWRITHLYSGLQLNENTLVLLRNEISLKLIEFLLLI
jgi:hypothetical protein